MDRGPLRAHMDAAPTGPAVSVLVDLCEAAHHAHRHGVVHGDLKPENVLVSTRGGTTAAKIGDWGLANVLLGERTAAGGLTPAYAAPEAVGDGAVDPRTDVYQLGVLAYELLTGELPFQGSNPAAVVNAVLTGDPAPPSELDPSLPAALDAPVLTALAAAPDDRPGTALHLRDTLREAVDSG